MRETSAYNAGMLTNKMKIKLYLKSNLRIHLSASALKHILGLSSTRKTEVSISIYYAWNKHFFGPIFEFNGIFHAPFKK